MQNDPTLRQSEPMTPTPTEPSTEPAEQPTPADQPAPDQGEPSTPHVDAKGEDAGAAYVVRDGVRVRQ